MIVSSEEDWKKFLHAAGHMYKYPFKAQMLIYAQRPDATACASLELWNEKMNCWVNKGAQGIALIDLNDPLKMVYHSTKDKDYDNLIKFWSGKADISRKQKIDVSAPKKTQPAKKATESKKQPQNTKASSKTATAITQTVAKKPTKSELKTQFNMEVQRALSQVGYSKDEINYIAKLVCKHFSEENFKQEIHNDLRIELGEYAYQQAYNCLKPILKKYVK